MDHKPIPAHRLLPEPSILEKIKALRPESVNEIFDSFENIAAQRRAAASKISLSAKLKGAFSRAFSEGLFFHYHPWQHAHTDFQKPANSLNTPALAMNRDWAVTGDDLRAAINAHIETHGLADKLPLTEKERQSLDYVARDYTNNHPRPAAPAL